MSSCQRSAQSLISITRRPEMKTTPASVCGVDLQIYMDFYSPYRSEANTEYHYAIPVCFRL